MGRGKEKGQINHLKFLSVQLIYIHLPGVDSSCYPKVIKVLDALILQQLLAIKAATP